MAALGIESGAATRMRDVPVLGVEDFGREVLDAVGSGERLVALFGVPESGSASLLAVLAHDREGRLKLLRSERVRESYPALTPRCTQAHLFEREIAEQWRLTPEGHPWLKPVRQPPEGAFFRVDGDVVHEVAVGPVHAGVIEPGHFRFQCHGERVLFLEIALGYQHRGVERALVTGPSTRTIHLVETLAGDTSIGHALAYARAVEALADVAPSERAQAIRAIALELERVANHVGDLGALANDVGYLPTASFCGRLRGEFLNLTARMCGSRLGRGLVRPGGVRHDLDDGTAGAVRDASAAALAEVADAVGLLWDSATVRARFEETGTVSLATCEALGLVGPAARASGAERDARTDFADGAWRAHPIAVATAVTGDVQARAWVRWLEIERSVRWIGDRLATLPAGAKHAADAKTMAPDAVAVSLVEGWRGEICHVAVTDAGGRFLVYKVVDPSFHNWAGLAAAMRHQHISDFPLCNKSFNLSYCGHDL